MAEAVMPRERFPARPPPWVLEAVRGEKLNVGCGRDVRPRGDGWTNLDVAPLDGVDVVHDLFSFPYPFEDAAFDYALASHVIEHLPQILNGRDGLVQVIDELHRVLRPGGMLHIKVPHYKRPAHEYFANPTHYRLVTPRTFDGFLGAPGTCVTYHTGSRFRSIWARTNHRTSLFGGRLTSYHLRRYLRVDNLPVVKRPHELEIFLQK